MAKPSFNENLKRQLAERNLSFKSITAMVIFGMIILVFVLMSGNNHQMTGVGYAAQVNNAYISLKDLDAETSRVERSFGQMFGQLGGAQRSFMTSQALNSLIQGELINQYAEKARIFATDHEVKEVIVKELPYFQEDGRFRRDRYEQILEANRLTPNEFEEKLRKDRKTMRVRQLMEASSSPLKMELEKKKQLSETQMSFAFARLDKNVAVEGMAVTDADVDAKLADASFKSRVEADFAKEPLRYDTQEEVRAQHILIKVDAEKPESDAAARKKIDEIRAKTATQDFGTLAAQNSEDMGSKAAKGDLGFFGRGKMVPEFETVAFAAKVGEVSQPVKSPFGYHLIKVTEKKEAKKAELKDVERQIAKRLINEERYEAEVKSLEEKLAAKDLAAVNAQLAKMGVKWQETGLVEIGTDFIPSMGSREATQAAFKLSAANPLSGIVRESDGSGQKFVLQYKGQSSKPAAEPVSYEMLARERSSERLNQWLEGLQKEAKILRNPSVGANDPMSLGL